jgi:hypothetical protein
MRFLSKKKRKKKSKDGATYFFPNELIPNVKLPNQD